VSEGCPSRYPLGGSASSSILVLQFALYTGLSTLYVVGCDGNSTLGNGKRPDTQGLEQCVRYKSERAVCSAVSESTLSTSSPTRSLICVSLTGKRINYMWKVSFAFVQKEYPAVQLVYVQPPAKIVEHGRDLGVHLVNATTHREAQALIQAGKPTFSLPPHETS
jgi:hypothetical protein